MTIKEFSSQHPTTAKIIKVIIFYPAVFSSLWALLGPLDPFGIQILKTLGIGGYIGLSSITFFVTIIAIEFSIRIKKGILPRIETELRKNEKIDPMFFRSAGPYWVDFEKHYIFKRKEVDEIISNLKKEPIQIVEGNPASGKSVLLKHIGFDLSNSGYKVFYIDCNYIIEEDLKKYFDDVQEINDKKYVVIIDNYHLKIDNCENFLRDYRHKGIAKTKILIGTRPFKNINIKRDLEIESLTKNKINKTNILSEHIFDKIINQYLKEQYHLSNDKIKECLYIFSDYKIDLWYLSWALKAFNPEKNELNTRIIYEKIKESILAIGSAEEVFFPLSILNRDETPVERRILTNEEYELGIEEEKINALIEQNEIIEKEVEGLTKRTALIFHHSSFARLYYQTYIETNLGEAFKDKYMNLIDNLPKVDFILNYLINSDVLFYIDTTSPFFMDHIAYVINENSTNLDLKKKIGEAIQHTVNSDQILVKIEMFFYGLQVSMNIESEINGINFDRLAQRINETEDIQRISSFLSTISGPILNKFIEKINLKNISSKLQNDNDIWSIAGILSALYRTDPDKVHIIISDIGVSKIINLFKNVPNNKKILHDPNFPEETMARIFGAIAIVDDTLTEELLKIIRDKVQNLSLKEIEIIVSATFDQATLYGDNFIITATEKLINSIEEIVKLKISNEADSAVIQQFKDLLCFRLPNWNEELNKFTRRIQERFELTCP